MAILVVMMVVFAISIQHVDLNAMSDVGLISVLSPLYWVALFGIIASLCVVIHIDEAPEYVYVLHMLAIIFVMHSLPPILYGTLRYSWAWKHIGIVDYIMRTGTVNPSIHLLDAYHNWPGFFSFNAMITQIAGVASPLTIAIWAELGNNVFAFGALLIVYRALTDDRRLIWLGILIFFLTNWIGQDYYSPQAMAYFLYLAIVGICLGWFRTSLMTNLPDPSRWRWLARLRPARNFVQSLIDRSRVVPKTLEPSDAYTRAGLFAIIIVALFTIVSSHQLTPIMLIGAIAFLAITGQISLRGLPIIVILLTLTWILFVADHFLGGNIKDMVTSVGQVSGNVGSNLINLQNVSAGQRIVAIIGRGLTISSFLMGIVGAIRRIRVGYVDLPVLAILLAPVLVPLGNNYGGEILFRVVLFSLPSIAFLGAAIIYPTPEHGRPRLWGALAAIANMLLVIAFFFAAYGKEQQYWFTQYEVEGGRYLYTFAPPNTLLIVGNGNFPSQFLNYENFTPVFIANEDKESRDRIMSDPAGRLSLWMDNSAYAATYLIITRGQKIESDTLGELPPGGLAYIEQSLKASPRFTVIFQNPDVTVFVLNRNAMPVHSVGAP